VSSTSSTANAAAQAVIVTQQDPDGALTLHYRTPTPALLRVAIPAYPGWRATLASGQELQTMTADAAFLGIPVPAGEGDLHVQYQPTSFRPAASLSLLALLAALAAVMRPTWTRQN
jgi:uncharacterized membrane protein YfhO